MIAEIAVALLVSGLNIGLHAAMMPLLMAVHQRQLGRDVPRRTGPWLARIMVLTVTMLMAAHTVEVAVWAAAMRLVGALAEPDAAFYFAFVSYTTIGYGDYTPLKEWRLLGPFAGMNGVLLFGWSTALIFQILTAAYRKMSRGPDLS